MARASLALFCVLGACGCSRAPSSTMAAVLDSLVPGVRIGALAAPLAHKYHLKLDGVFGYSSEYPNRAATDRAARGLPGIAVQVDEEVSLDHRPSDSARIVRVALDFYSRQAADSVRELLTRKLGPAERRCYTAYKPQAMAVYFWPDEKSAGLMLLVPLDTSRGGALLTFGAMRLDSHPDFKDAPRGSCDAA